MPRSPDLTPCDFFLWGHLKNRVYQTPPQDMAELRACIIQEVIREFKIPPRRTTDYANTQFALGEIGTSTVVGALYYRSVLRLT